MTETETKVDTLIHIAEVGRTLNKIIRRLLDRADTHDESKLDTPELEAFAEASSLSETTYDSAEYKAQLEGSLKMALTHHYAKNRHHPQHFNDGLKGMNLIDVLEMFCDWAASTKRQNDGNLNKSIQKNAERFGIGPQLVAIFENSVELVE